MALSGRLGECPCGSGEWPEELFDARGIFVAHVCSQCEQRTRAKYRPEIFTNSQYAADDLGWEE